MIPRADLGGVCTRKHWVFATLSQSLTRSISSSGALAIGYVGTNWELDFRQCSFHHIMQVLRVCAFCAFSSPPAFPPCSCSLAFRHQVRRLGRLRARSISGLFPQPPAEPDLILVASSGSPVSLFL